MLRRFSINYAIFSMGVDALSVALALLLSERVRPLLNPLSFAREISFPLPFPSQVYVIFPILWVVILFVLAVYDGRRNLRVVDEFASLSGGAALAAATQAGILYLTFREVSRVQFGLFVLIAYLSMIFWRSLMRIFFHRVTGANQRHVLIVGAGPVGHQMQSQIEEFSHTGLSLVGFLDDDPVKRKENIDLILGPLSEVRDVIRKKSIDDVVIALPPRAHERTNRIVAELLDLPVKIWIIPDYFALALHRAVIDDFAGIPMLDLRAPAIDEYQRMLKRGFDIVATILLLIPAIPVMGLAALSIWLDDGCPVLLRQRRVGENGKSLLVYKFRTMVKNAEQLQKQVETIDEQGNILHKQRDDPRITRAGKFLRRFSIDEFPQFFNVLIGNMSLVGPRPELPYLVEKYQPWQRKRFAVPQGMTGWWQIHGRSDKPMHLHTEDDLYYIQNYSIYLDIQILIQTVWAIIRGKGAY
jgi:exopolysaccharide biosynthesis polyprenyl glycosylphosphotransferase